MSTRADGRRNATCWTHTTLLVQKRKEVLRYSRNELEDITLSVQIFFHLCEVPKIIKFAETQNAGF